MQNSHLAPNANSTKAEKPWYRPSDTDATFFFYPDGSVSLPLKNQLSFSLKNFPLEMVTSLSVSSSLPLYCMYSIIQQKSWETFHVPENSCPQRAYTVGEKNNQHYKCIKYTYYGECKAGERGIEIMCEDRS